MKIEQLIVLLPCQSWEDFPVDVDGEDAQGLWSAWTTLWHPALLASAGSMPKWHQADDPPESIRNSLVVIPSVSETQIPPGWTEQVSGQGTRVLQGMSGRDALVNSALGSLKADAPVVESKLVADFLALGLGYLLVELLLRQMYSTGHFDEDYFANELNTTAASAMGGDTLAARDGLRRCFDLLSQARDHVNSVEAHLIDLTLVASTTIGSSLRQELSHCSRMEVPINVLATAEVIEQMAHDQPETLSKLREALECGAVDLIGGEYCECDLGLTPIEEIDEQLKRGNRVYREHLGRSASIYGRRRSGLSPVLPQLLKQYGFRGAVYSVFDGGYLPRLAVSKANWEGVDGSEIDVICGVPLDASKSESCFKLVQRMAESIERDYVSTVVLAHWPGQVNPWYDDLRRIASYTPALGRFVTLGQYFESTHAPEVRVRFEPDEYRWTSSLTRAVTAEEKDPISRHVHRYARQTTSNAARSVAVMASLARGEFCADHPAELTDGTLSPLPSAGISATREAITNDCDTWSTELGSGMKNLARSLSSDRTGQPGGKLIANPFCQTRSDTWNGVSVPGIGFAWLDVDGTERRSASSGRGKRHLQLAEGNRLRNEFFEVTVNLETGAIQSIRDYQNRGNRLSQQIAFRQCGGANSRDRWQEAQAEDSYSVMVAEDVEVTAASSIRGEITSRGKLVDRQGRYLAGFQQKLQISRESHILQLEVHLDPVTLPEADPWQSYYAARFAWPDEEAQLWHSVAMGRHPTLMGRFAAPHYVEIQSSMQRTAILTGGHPFHRRSGPRMLDTLLLVHGESRREFRLAIGLDVPEPLPAALDLLIRNELLTVPAERPRSGRAGWFLHTDARNVVSTDFQLLPADAIRVGSAPAADADLPMSARPIGTAGFRLRLLETEGRARRIRLSAFREILAASRTDFLGRPLEGLKPEGGKVALDVGPYQWTQIEAEW